MPKATGDSSNPDISSSRKLTFKDNDGRLKLLPPSTSSTTIQQIKFPEIAGTAGQSFKIKTDGISTDPNESNRKIVLTEWGAGGGGGGDDNANTITLANETGNDERFIVFSNTSAPNSGTSSVSLKTNSSLKFNSSTNVLSTTTFNGNLTGTATTATNLSSTLTIAQGGTNATTASDARTALGVDAAGTDNSTNVMLSSVDNNYLTLDEDNQILTAGVVPITLGGTGATTASAARSNLDAQILLTDNEGEFTETDQSKLNSSSMESKADTTSFTDVVNAGGLMTFNNTKPITGDIVIGEDDNDLMVVNSNIISNGYIKKPTRFKPKTTIVGTPFTLNFGTALDTITHLDGTSSTIDTRVYLDDIKDINKVLVMGKIHIGYSTWNIFASVLLIKKLYDSSGNLITSAGNSGNIEVGSGSDDIPNTTDSFFDASIAVTPGGSYNFHTALNNLGGHFLDTNPTEGVSGISKISYHYAIKPLHNLNNAIKVGQPWNTGDENRCSAATMLTLVPFCS